MKEPTSIKDMIDILKSKPKDQHLKVVISFMFISACICIVFDLTIPMVITFIIDFFCLAELFSFYKMEKLDNENRTYIVDKFFQILSWVFCIIVELIWVNEKLTRTTGVVVLIIHTILFLYAVIVTPVTNNIEENEK